MSGELEAFACLATAVVGRMRERCKFVGLPTMFCIMVLGSILRQFFVAVIVPKAACRFERLGSTSYLGYLRFMLLLFLWSGSIIELQ